MPNEKDNSLRTVSPKRWALVTATSLATITAPAITTILTTTAAHATAGAEAGEAGEAGVVLTGGSTEFLTRLGYFESTYRIIATLYLEGHRDLAREHMEASHHAFYEDIEEKLTEYSAPGFIAEADAFNAAIADDAGEEQVLTALGNVVAALRTNEQSAGATLSETIMSLKDLMALAAAEYSYGVHEGKVEAGIEYRDSWGFYETTRLRAVAMNDSEDADTAKAGAAILEQLEGLDALYPSLTATDASDSAVDLTVASGWIEIIALRNK